MRPFRDRLPRLLGAALIVLFWVTPATAQLVLDREQDIAFDRPEAWAMLYFASASLPSTVTSYGALQPGEWEVSLEYAQIPSLSEDERRVGFNGSKLEDLNRVPFLVRPAVRVGLGKRFSLAASYVPPVEIDDVEPHILTLSLGRPVHETEHWQLNLGLVGQVGRVEGDFTCSASVVAAGDDPELNPFGCEEPSSDEHRYASLGLELGSRWELGVEGAWAPYLALSYHHMDLEFRVDAAYSGIIDKTVLLTDGRIWSAAAGLAYVFSERWALSGEFFYTPLDVVRPPSTSTQTDALFNLRAVLSYSFG